MITLGGGHLGSSLDAVMHPLTKVSWSSVVSNTSFHLLLTKFNVYVHEMGKAIWLFVLYPFPTPPFFALSFEDNTVGRCQ